MSTSLSEQGIAAYNAGNHQEAGRLLSQAVKEEKTNPDAWYYLAQVLSDPEKKKQCLQMAIRVDPDYTVAREQLAALESSEDDPFADADEPPSRATPTRQRTTSSGTGSGVSMGMFSAIPGAPASFSGDTAASSFQDFGQNSASVLSGDVEAVASKATWWTVASAVVIAGFFNGLMLSVANIISTIRFDFVDITFPGIILWPFLGLLTLGAGITAGGMLSYWYMARKESSATLLEHFGGFVGVVAPASLVTGLLIALERLGLGDSSINSVLTLREVLISFDAFEAMNGYAWVLMVIAVVITGYALFLLNKHFSRIHGSSGAAGWVAGILALSVMAFTFI